MSEGKTITGSLWTKWHTPKNQTCLSFSQFLNVGCYIGDVRNKFLRLRPNTVKSYVLVSFLKMKTLEELCTFILNFFLLDYALWYFVCVVFCVFFLVFLPKMIFIVPLTNHFITIVTNMHCNSCTKTLLVWLNELNWKLKWTDFLQNQTMTTCICV